MDVVPVRTATALFLLLPHRDRLRLQWGTLLTPHVSSSWFFFVFSGPSLVSRLLGFVGRGRKTSSLLRDAPGPFERHLTPDPDFKTEGDLYQNVDMTSSLLWVDILCGPQDPQMKFQPESDAPIWVLCEFLGLKRAVNRRSLEGHRKNFIGKYL